MWLCLVSSELTPVPSLSKREGSFGQTLPGVSSVDEEQIVLLQESVVGGETS